MSYEAERQFDNGFRDEWARNHPDAYESVVTWVSEPWLWDDPSASRAFSLRPMIEVMRDHASSADVAREKGHYEKLLKRLRKGTWMNSTSCPGLDANDILGAELALIQDGVQLEYRAYRSDMKVWLALEKVLPDRFKPGGCHGHQLRLVSCEPQAGEQTALF